MEYEHEIEDFDYRGVKVFCTVKIQIHINKHEEIQIESLDLDTPVFYKHNTITQANYEHNHLKLAVKKYMNDVFYNVTSIYNHVLTKWIEEADKQKYLGI